MNLYDQIGGAMGIETLMSSFYQRVLQDPLLQPFFAEAEIERLQKMQAQFFSMALGMPNVRDDFSLFEIHADRGIKREHLSRFTEHLLATLHDAGINESHSSEIVARIATYSPQILGESGGVDG
jgi:hemoglobin